MLEALTAWRWYAREIESDLSLYHRRSIKEWLRGDTMDSRELLVLLDGLPDKSMFKKWAHRGGDWSNEEYRQARLINETALARADGYGYSPELVLSPAEHAAEHAHEAWQKKRHDDNLAQLRGERR